MQNFRFWNTSGAMPLAAGSVATESAGGGELPTSAMHTLPEAFGVATKLDGVAIHSSSALRGLAGRK